MKCPSCSHLNSEFNVRCARCGAALPGSTASTSALAETSAAAPLSVRVRPGDVFDRFQVVDRLGEGAMGVVLAAHDPRLDRNVAIKVLHPGPRRIESGRARLVREAQAMAKLSHPNVVTVHEVGVAGEQVFIVMEKVEGQSLRAWLAEQRRPLRAIMDLFLQAGRGLAAAHRAGFVHRDFKPDNVLVGDDGRARVTDFGLVALAEVEADSGGDAPEDAGRGVALTSVGARLGTPVYMAPEQHEGKPVDARADQFAFCVALWEALAGERPFGGETYDELRDNVMRSKPREPRRGAEMPARIRRILARGLSVDRDARYPDMEALLSDISKDPAVARRKWLVFAGAFALALAGPVAFGILRSSTATLCEGGEAKLAGVWDDAVEVKIQAAFAGTGRPYAEDTYRRVAQALDERARAWVAMYTDSCEATNVRGEQSPALLDLRTQCLDRRRREMGALAAIFGRGPDPELVDRAVQASLSLPALDACADTTALSAAVPLPPDPAARAKIDGLRARLDDIQALHDAGKYKEGLPLASALAGEAKAVQYTPLEAEALSLRGRFERWVGDAKAAEATFGEAIPLAARARDDTLVARCWSDLLYTVGVSQARPADALANRPAAEAAVARIGEDAATSGAVLANLGRILAAKGEYAEGIRYLERALGILERTLGPDHPQVGTTLLGLGGVLFDTGRYEDARTRFERTIAIYTKRLGPDHPQVAGALNNMSMVLREMKKLDEASSGFARALAIAEKAHGADHPTVANILTNLGIIATEQGRMDEARRLHERALAIRKKALGDDHPDVSNSLLNLGGVAERIERWAEAQSYYERALALREKALGPDHVAVARTLSNLGGALSAQGKPDEARKRHERAVAISEKALGPDAEILVEILTGLGEDYVLLRQPEKAFAPLERALRIGDAKGEAFDHEKSSASTRFTLARALWDANRDRTRAVALAEQARGAYAEDKEKFARKLRYVEAWLKAREPGDRRGRRSPPPAGIAPAPVSGTVRSHTQEAP